MSNCVSETVAASRNRWPQILTQLGISVPENNKHGPCPICGGKDRFRFDDKLGRGTWICNQCRHGDGLDLVARANACDLLSAARLVAGLTLAPSTTPAREKAPLRPIGERAQQLLSAAREGKSPYLAGKGHLHNATMLNAQSPLTVGGATFGHDALILPVQSVTGELVGGQLINAGGEKRLLPGTQMKGAFIALNTSHETTTIVITEGYATALTLSLAANNMVVAAMSANNLRNVALALKNRYPDSCIILAGDHDLHSDGSANTGMEQAVLAAQAVNGWVSFPPGDIACDWDDYRQQYGIDAVKTAFQEQMYQPDCTEIPLTRMEQTYMELSTALPLRKGSDGFDTRQDYLIKGYLPSSSVTSAYGASGSYKSFLAVSWGCHIATGKPWAGKPVTQGAVIYVVGEGGIGVPRRIRAWEETLNGGSPIDSLYRVDCPIFPASPESVQQVIKAANDVKAATGMPVRLIILDTLARCFGGSDENAAKDMGAFIQGCDYIKAATQATVLIIHHSGKDQERGARGSSAFRAALDVEFNVRREGEGGALILSCTKMKDAEEPPRQAYDLFPVDLYIDNDGDQISSLVLKDEGRPVSEADDDSNPELAGISRLTENHMALWQAIRKRTANGEPCTRALLRDDMRKMGFDVSKKFNRWLEKLVRDGLVICDGEHVRPLLKEIKVGN
jgi:putative DNA primase/helicase